MFTYSDYFGRPFANTIIMKQQFSFLSRLLAAPLKYLVKTKVIPQHPIDELDIDPSKPVLYVMEQDSAVDKVILLRTCLQLGLPDPRSSNGDLPGLLCVNTPRSWFRREKTEQNLVTALKTIIEAHKAQPDIDVQMVPVSMFWGRAPGKKDMTFTSWLADLPHPGSFRKAWTVLFTGRDQFLRFAHPISLREISDRFGPADVTTKKVSRVARFHFYRQRLAATGPRLPQRSRIFSQLIKTDGISEAIAAEAKNSSPEKAERKAAKYLDEIAANYSISLIVALDRSMTWLWNKLYQGINVNNSEQVRQLADAGHEIVYVPCHRSHMDYLLLSYVLYHQGLVPPHIAAGINLNFWPAGPIFRRGGAFFIRRTFKGNKLYAAVFREYLTWLIQEGYPVEYFSEGGRSRTGRLLTPKVGMLAMTMQSQLYRQSRPITLVPIYLGYEHVMEVNTYLKELAGQKKEKESFSAVLGILKKLRNYGQGYVNFGTPITLDEYLTQQVPNWHDAIQQKGEKPEWFNPAVAGLGNRVMQEINNAAAINGLTLSALILLSTDRFAITRSSLARQMDIYLKLARSAPYHSNVTLPEQNGAELLEQTILLDKFQVEEDSLGDIIRLDRRTAILMTYYRNNIIHLFIIPSLIATIIYRHQKVATVRLTSLVKLLYPLMRSELFLSFDEARLEHYLEQVLASLIESGLIEQHGDELVLPEAGEAQVQLARLAKTVEETLQRYAIVLMALQKLQECDETCLEQTSLNVAERLSKLHGISAPEFFDKQLFSNLISEMTQLGLLAGDTTAKEQVDTLCSEVADLLNKDIALTIAQVLAR